MAAFMAVIATLSTVILMFTVLTDVVVRNLTNNSVPGLLEMAETSLVFAIFFGLAYTGATNGHIAVNLLTNRLPDRLAHWTRAVSWILMSLTLVWLIWATGSRAVDSVSSGETRFGLVEWLLWPSRCAIVVGFTALLIVAVTNCFRLLRGQHVLGYKSTSIDI